MSAPRPTCRSSCTRTGDASGMVRRTNGSKAPVSSSSPRTCLTGGTTPARASSAVAAVSVREGSQEAPLGAQRGDQPPRPTDNHNPRSSAPPILKRTSAGPGHHATDDRVGERSTLPACALTAAPGQEQRPRPECQQTADTDDAAAVAASLGTGPR